MFSLYATKNMMTAEGAIATTDDDGVAERLRLYRNHGMRVRYHHEDLGTNFKPTDISAALGLAQLRRLEGGNERRRANAARFSSGLHGYTSRSGNGARPAVSFTLLPVRRHSTQSRTLPSPPSIRPLTWRRTRVSASARGSGIEPRCPREQSSATTAWWARDVHVDIGVRIGDRVKIQSGALVWWACDRRAA